MCMEDDLCLDEKIVAFEHIEGKILNRCRDTFWGRAGFSKDESPDFVFHVL